MILTGNTKIKLFVGDTKVRAAYVGTAKVYPNSSLAVTASLAFAAAGGTGVLSIQVEDGQGWGITGLPAGWSVSPASGSGPATVTVTAANNTTAQVKGGTITVISEDLSAGCSVSQTAGAIIYETPVVTAFGYPDIPASGGTVTPNVYNYQQTYTWNGVPGSGGVLTTGGTILYSHGGGSVTSGNLGATIRGRTAIVAMTTRVDMNGVTGQNATCTVYQQANSMSYGDHYFNITDTGRWFPSIGGASVITVESRQKASYTSGAESSVGTSREPQVSVFGAGLSCIKLDPSGIRPTYKYEATMTANTSTTNSRSGYIRFSLAIAPVTQTVNFSQDGIKGYVLRISGSSAGGIPFYQWAEEGWVAVSYGASSSGPWTKVYQGDWSNVAPSISVSWPDGYRYARMEGPCHPGIDAAIKPAGNLTVISGGMTWNGHMDCVVQIMSDGRDGSLIVEPQR